jgi:uncharacterized YigZ family protein
MPEMHTVMDSAEAVLRVKGSKFIAIAEPALDETEVSLILKRVRSRFPDATHHCYAWRLHPENIREFAQDDGEPSGTAGIPILNRLKSHGLVRTLAVVVRYYGGTKLGKGGLIKAYGDATEEVLTQIGISPLRAICMVEIAHSYPESGLIEQILNSCEATVVGSDYGETVSLTVACPATSSGALVGKLSGIAYLGVLYAEKQTVYG